MNSLLGIYQSLICIVAIFITSSLSAAIEKPEVLDCSCSKISWKEAFDSSHNVVFGEVKQVQRHGDDLSTGDFVPMEVFKGQEAHITKIVGSSKSGVSCRNVLHPGFYIAFGNESHSVVLNKCAASRQLRPQEDLVSTLTELKKYADIKVTSSTPTIKASNEKQALSTESTDWFQMFTDWWDSWEW